MMNSNPNPGPNQNRNPNPGPNPSRRALVIGMGATGLSLARHLDSRGLAVAAVDDRAHPPMASEFAAALPRAELRRDDFRRWPESAFAEFATVAVSSGVSVADGKIPPEKIVGDAALFGAAWRRLAPPAGLIAVTGTNGKSTVAALCAHLCRAAGLAAAAVGNIGEPLLDALSDWSESSRFPDIVVAELSSFQLEFAPAFPCDSAAVLNVGEDHLDRHGDLKNYAAVKGRVYREAQSAVVNRDDPVAAGLCGDLDAARVTGFSSAGNLTDGRDFVRRRGDGALGRAGMFFAPETISPVLRAQPANALAALALVDFANPSPAALARGLAGFDNLRHRRETVATVNGVRFVDDSKATNAAAARFALLGESSPVALIAGGQGKGQDFAGLARAAAGRVREVVLLGGEVGEMARAFAAENIPVRRARDMAAAVRAAAESARPGDAVLLSPACASFDLFADYRARGDAFRAAAMALAEANHAG